MTPLPEDQNAQDQPEPVPPRARPLLQDLFTSFGQDFERARDRSTGSWDSNYTAARACCEAGLSLAREAEDFTEDEVTELTELQKELGEIVIATVHVSAREEQMPGAIEVRSVSKSRKT